MTDGTAEAAPIRTQPPPGNAIHQAVITSEEKRMELELTDKVAVVTGAGRGIGLAICRRLIAEGATVVANARSESPALTQFTRQGVAQVVLGDMLDPATAEHLVAAAGGRVDVLVNNAGIAPARPDGFLKITDDDWQHTFGLDLFAGIRMIR